MAASEGGGANQPNKPYLSWIVTLSQLVYYAKQLAALTHKQSKGLACLQHREVRKGRIISWLAKSKSDSLIRSCVLRSACHGWLNYVLQSMSF
jgi:hypothetical protein